LDMQNVSDQLAFTATKASGIDNRSQIPRRKGRHKGHKRRLYEGIQYRGTPSNDGAENK
jgi:hypothetical protein